MRPLQPALTPVTTALVSEEELEKADNEGRQIIAGPLALPDPKDLSPGEEIVPSTWVIDNNERPFKAFSVPLVRPMAPPWTSPQGASPSVERSPTMAQCLKEASGNPEMGIFPVIVNAQN